MSIRKKGEPCYFIIDNDGSRRPILVWAKEDVYILEHMTIWTHRQLQERGIPESDLGDKLVDFLVMHSSTNPADYEVVSYTQMKDILRMMRL